MKIGFYFDASHLNGFSNYKFINGEIGISGTDSSFFRVINGLAIVPQMDVYLYGKNIDEYPNVSFLKIESLKNAVEQAKKDAIDFFLFGLKPTPEIFDAITQAEKIGLNLIVIAQNPIREDLLQLLTKTKIVLKIVFVESFNLSSIRHKKAFYKGVVIPNGIEKDVYAFREITLPENLNVFYLGSITPSKGFHHIAKAWPKVLNATPNAQLHIIGSGKLYNNNKKLGTLGLADEGYEKEFTPYIGRNKEELEKNNIIIHGLLNRNQIIEIIYNSKLACINPNVSGSLECCSVSSLEIQMCGVPIVAGKAGGNLNTIINNKTGILIANNETDELSDAIVKLLTDDNLNLSMRKAARAYMIHKYEMELINTAWINFFNKFITGEKFEIIKITTEISSLKMYIKEAIRVFNKISGSNLFG